MNVLELSNAEMGTFRVRLLRKGEEYGLHHQLIYDDDEPTIEFYGPAAEGERSADAHFMGRFYAWQFRDPSNGWSSVGAGGYCGVSPENSRAIDAWLERELNRPWTPPPPRPRPRPPSQARANRPIELQHAGNRRVTLYVGDLFGYVNKEAEWVRVDRRPYAQYVDSIFVDYLPRRARRARRMILTDDSDLVILLGWGHPDLQQATETEELSSPFGQRDRKMTVTRTKYVGADSRYDQEFENALDAYLASLPLAQLLLDLRGETVTERRGLAGRKDPPAVPVFHPSGVWERDVEAARAKQAVAAVFVSYHHGGDADARERFERENGAVVRSSSIYPGEISTGREVRREIRRRIVGCDFLVVLVGRDTYARRWVDWEIRAALTRGGDGAPTPVVGILLPEMAALGTLLSSRLGTRPGEPVARLLQRSDELSHELMAETGATVPARLLDNLLSSYAALIPWPASQAVLLDALASSVNRARPVNGRCLLAQNLPLPSDDASVPDPALERVGTPQQTPNLRVPEDYDVTTAPARNADMESPAPSGVEKMDRAGHPGTLPARGSTVGKPAMAAPPVRLTAEDRPGWLVRALQIHGPEAVLAGLDTEDDPEHARLVSALRRHAHVLAPLDSETSMAATLLARLDKEDALGGVKEKLTALLRGPHLVAVVSLPDLPPAGLTQVLDGGESAIVAMAADPAERWLASLTWIGTLRVWDLATGTVRHVLARPEGTSGNSGRRLVADPRGGWLAFGDPEGLVEVWDPIDGARLHTFTSKYGGINALAVDPEGAWLAAADSVGVIQLWSMPSGRPLLEKFVGVGGASAMVADPEGGWLATGGGGKVRVWDVSTGERLHELDSPGFVSALAVSPQGRWLCCAGDGATVRVWPMPVGEPARDLTNRARAENKRVQCLVADPAGRWLATAGHSGTVRTWSTTSGAKELVLVGHRGGPFGGVGALAVAPDGTWLASAGTDRTVRVWDMATGAQHHCLTGHTGDISALVTDRAGRWLASGGTDGQIRIWDPVAQPTPFRHAATPLGSVTALTADPSGSWHAYAQGDDGSITIRDARTGKELRTAASHDSHLHGAVTALQADPHGTWLASAGRDGTIRIWDPRDGSERYLLVGRAHQEYKEIATRLTAAPGGQWLACSGEGPKIWIWSPITGERLNTLSAAGGEIEAVVINPLGTWLASAGADGAIRLWHPDASHPHRVLKGHQSPVHALAVDPSGTYLVSCGEDATIQVWNLENGTKSILEVPVPARHLAMCPRGGWFASTGGDAIIRVWEPRDGVERCVLAGHDVALAGITPDPTGRYLASVAADTTVRIWEPSTGAAVTSLRVDGTLNSVLWTPDHLILGGDQGAYLLNLRGG